VSQRGQDLGADPPQFLAMGERQLPQHGLAPGGDLDQDGALVLRVADPAEHADLDHPVQQPDDGVVLELQLPGQGADRRLLSRRKSLHGQEELVLPGLQARRAGGLLAERQEAAEEMPEAGEGGVLGVRRDAARRHLQGIYRITI
jgi:hypothetical protein